LSKNGNSVKIGKLGLAAEFSKKEGSIRAPTLHGLMNYMSPEMLGSEQYSYATDVWSCGCVLYEMITLRKAFDEKENSTLIESIMNKLVVLDENANLILQNLIEK
jgi:serine/threonine protein kinase